MILVVSTWVCRQSREEADTRGPGWELWLCSSLTLCLPCPKTDSLPQKAEGTVSPTQLDVNLSRLWEMVKDREPGVLQSMGSQRVGHDLATEQHQHPTLGVLVSTLHGTTQ